jgi:hypothetical protein
LAATAAAKHSRKQPRMPERKCLCVC